MTQTEWPSPIWARIAATTVACALISLFIDKSPAALRAFAPLNVATAEVTVRILGWLGIEAQRELATLVHSGGFGYEIAFRCTGMIPAGMLVASILAAGGSLISRLWGAAAGAFSIFAVNMIRLVSLFWIGVRFPAAFDVAHLLVWQGLTVLSVVGFFCWWRRRTLLDAVPDRATLPLVATSH